MFKTTFKNGKRIVHVNFCDDREADFQGVAISYQTDKINGWKNTVVRVPKEEVLNAKFKIAFALGYEVDLDTQIFTAIEAVLKATYNVGVAEATHFTILGQNPFIV